MTNQKNAKLLRNQAMAIQCSCFSLQKMIPDIGSGGVITKQLLESTQIANEGDLLDTISTGNKYMLLFILPLAIELALKALLTHIKKNPKKIHDLSKLYKEIPKTIQEKLQSCFEKEFNTQNIFIKDILESHKNAFVNWRYLNNVDDSTINNKHLQYIIFSIIKIYDELAIPSKV